MTDISTLQMLRSCFHSLIQNDEIPNCPSPDFNSDYQRGIWSCISIIEQEISNLDSEMEKYRLEMESKDY